MEGIRNDVSRGRNINEKRGEEEMEKVEANFEKKTNKQSNKPYASSVQASKCKRNKKTRNQAKSASSECVNKQTKQREKQEQTLNEKQSREGIAKKQNNKKFSVSYK